MQKNLEMELFTKHTPTNLEHIFGYRKTRRWVAFFWDRKVGPQPQGYCFDGAVFNPLNQLAWDTFFSHPLIVAMNHQRIEGCAVKRFEFGDALQSSKHWLLLDCRDRSLFAVSKAHAMNQLSLFTDQSVHAVPNPGAPDLPAGQTVPGPGGALEMVAQMTAWLDVRKALLKINGEWPLLN